MPRTSITRAPAATALSALTACLTIALGGCDTAPLREHSLQSPAMVRVPVQQSALHDGRGRFREIFCAVLQARAGTACEQALVAHPEIRPRVSALVSLAGAVGGSPLAKLAPEGLERLLQGALGADCDPGNLLAQDQMIPQGTLLALVNADHWAVMTHMQASPKAAVRTLADRNHFPRPALVEAALRCVEEARSGAVASR